MNRHFFGAWVFNEFDTHTHTDIDEALNTSMILWGIAQVGAWTWDGGDLGVSSISVDMFRFMTAVCFRRFRVAVHAAVL